MICTTCGQDNPAHLVFCQACGQRLGPRVAPPTPPIGLSPPALNPLWAPQPIVPVHADARELPLGTERSKPDGPFVARPQPVAYEPPRPVATAPLQATPPRRLCAVCNAPNDEGVRYCNACGTQMTALAAAAAPAVAAPVPPIMPANSGLPIAPVRVLDVVPATQARDAIRLCGRCRGACDAGAQFCKFCGASLADAAVVAAQPISAAHAQSISPSPSGARPSVAAPPPRTDPAPPPIPTPAPPPVEGPAYAAPAPALALPGPPPVARSEYAQNSGVSSASTTLGKGRLVIIARDGGEGPSFPLHDVVDIGRSEGSIIIAEDGYLSPRHIRIFRKDGKLFVRDLGSTNGFYLRLSASSSLANPALNGAGKHARLGSMPPQPPTNVPRDASLPRASTPPDEATFPLRDQDLFLVGQQVIRFEVVRDGGEGLGPATEHGTLLFGTPAAPRYARLSQRTVEGVTRDAFYIRKRETVLGRESGDIVFTEDPFLSRRHAAIRVLDHGRFALCDLGSSNGTFLQVRGEVPIFDTDQFRIGQQLFRVDLTQDAQEVHVGAGMRP